MKRNCRKCGKEFDVKDRSLRCSKECLKKDRKEYRQKRYLRIKDIHLKRMKEWRKNNPKKCREYVDRNKSKYPEKVKERYERWAKNNPDKKRDSYKRWKKNNPDRFYANLIKQKNIRKSIIGLHTFAEWETLKAQYNWTCPCCHKSEPEIKLTEDHIIPVSRGGSDNIENIQPLCRSCNAKKHTRIIKY